LSFSLPHIPLDFPGNKPVFCVDKFSTNCLRDGTVCVTVASKFIPVFNLPVDHKGARGAGSTAF
jgi:hypothetical protein